ncbi:hypothetical protein A9K55_002085 [Cordyceps militaris]|uniref:Uncharacterized protein n=1 Tax=Cordyceps militaris TaxID=73501 RepID=A0A2H4SRR1_CORMI|nr:hypothetical protein A9K55_002085 [Cordyceps militaris]
MGIDKNTDLGGITGDEKEWQDVYNRIGELYKNAKLVEAIPEEVAENLTTAATAAKEKRQREPAASVYEQRSEMDWEKIEIDKTFVRIWDKHVDVTKAHKAQAAEKALLAEKEKERGMTAEWDNEGGMIVRWEPKRGN